jgi:hypothetical protein
MVRIGKQVYVKLKGYNVPINGYGKINRQLLSCVSCLPRNILEKIHFPPTVVRLPNTLMEKALKDINPETPVNFGFYSNKPSTTFKVAVELMNAHLKLPNAVIAVNIDSKTEELNETWVGAPMQLNFYRLFDNNGKLENTNRKTNMHIDLPSMRTADLSR